MGLCIQHVKIYIDGCFIVIYSISMNPILCWVDHPSSDGDTAVCQRGLRSLSAGTPQFVSGDTAVCQRGHRSVTAGTLQFVSGDTAVCQRGHHSLTAGTLDLVLVLSVTYPSISANKLSLPCPCNDSQSAISCLVINHIMPAAFAI